MRIGWMQSGMLHAVLHALQLQLLVVGDPDPLVLLAMLM